MTFGKREADKRVHHHAIAFPWRVPETAQTFCEAVARERSMAVL